MTERRLPPYDEAAERSTLGAMILNPNLAIDLCVELGVTKNSFYVPASRVLFDALVSMQSLGKAIDLLTVGSFLNENGMLDKVGGHVYLESLVDSCITTAHAEHYAQIVKSKEVARAVICLGAELIDSVYASHNPIDSAAEAVSALDVVINERSKTKTVDDVNEEIERSWDAGGIPSHLVSFGQMFKYEGMVVLGAYPSVGKTASMICETVNWCKAGLHVAAASLEMPEPKIRERMAGSVCGINTRLLCDDESLSGDLRRRVIAQLREMKAWKLTINDSSMTCDKFCAWARSMKAKGADLIWLDYLQLFSATSEEWRMPVEQRISMWSNKIKSVQKAIGIPVVVLSQLSRPFSRDTSSMPPPPTLSSLRYSGSIEQDADSVLLLYKDPDKEPSFFLENKTWPEYIDIAKQRNGDTGRIRVEFERETQRVKDAIDVFDTDNNRLEKGKDFEW
jgi:replicative DNA helicase